MFGGGVFGITHVSMNGSELLSHVTGVVRQDSFIQRTVENPDVCIICEALDAGKVGGTADRNSGLEEARTSGDDVPCGIASHRIPNDCHVLLVNWK